MGTIVRYAAQNGPGSSIINRIEVTGSYSPTPSDYYIGVDSSVPGGAITITLPLAAEAGNGKMEKYLLLKMKVAIAVLEISL